MFTSVMCELESIASFQVWEKTVVVIMIVALIGGALGVYLGYSENKNRN